MKKFLILIIINLFLIKESLANEIVYNTSFYNIDINNEIISDAKIREINNIKIISINSILDKILTVKNKNNFLKAININDELNYLIKNIIINDEFISKKKYKASIKVNFKYKALVKLLQNNKINYTDISSEKFLIIASEENKITAHGLSKNNSLYKSINKNQYGLINFFKPDLSTNDRFIMPFEKIKLKDINSLTKIANKYNTKKIFIILSKLENEIFYLDIDLYSVDNSQFYNLGLLKIKNYKTIELELYSFLNNWWKIKNQVNNSIENNITCLIKNNNIEELYTINSIINSISQIKLNNVEKINFGNNIQKITFFGNLKNLSEKLILESVYLKIKSNNECQISLIK